MQKIKPKKDELLNQILQEIADENNTIHNNPLEKSIPSNTKRFSNEKKIENIVIAMLVMLIIFVLFYNLDTTDAIEHNDTSEDKSSISKADQPTVQKQTLAQKETSIKEVKSKKNMQIIVTEEIKSNAKEKKVLKIQDPKTEREREKERLMRQMRN